MTTSPTGRALIESMEGCELKAYTDQRGIWTIGYGHTFGVQKGDTCTAAEADAFLAHDLVSAERTVNSFVRVPINQHQFDALVSLTFNIGAGNFSHSTLLNLLNEGDYTGAGNQFLVWNRTNGIENPGLTRRRVAERKLFLEAV